MSSDWMYTPDMNGLTPMARLKKCRHTAVPNLMAILMTMDEDDDTEPPIHQAARDGDVERVRELIEEGVDFEDANEIGLAPIHWAALNGSDDLAKLLLNRGAQVNARDYLTTGMTPYALAKNLGYAEIATLLSQHGGIR
jgi:ankyrin repeat protein